MFFHVMWHYNYVTIATRMARLGQSVIQRIVLYMPDFEVRHVNDNNTSDCKIRKCIDLFC